MLETKQCAMSVDNTSKNSEKEQQRLLVVSLTADPSSISSKQQQQHLTSPSRVGGKASSLANLYAIKELSSSNNVVPKAFALSVDFFQPWINEIKETNEFKRLLSLSTTNDNEVTTVCKGLQKASYCLTLSKEQSGAIQKVTSASKLVAVRSSAPEEDGTGASFAGAFETKLGIAANFDSLEKAIRDCFASLWDYRVFHYKQLNSINDSTTIFNKTGFAVVVMEMIDSIIAGVAFSANPLNSDRDELVIDSSWGLGESVVDGSVTADRYIVDKINKSPYKVIKETIGTKGVEKRLGSVDGDGGVIELTIQQGDERRTKSSLSHPQLQQLTKLVCLVEDTYGMPVDIEWAFIEGINNTNSNELELKLLQARPITTLFTVDDKMMTNPGEKRVLYFDGNIISEATTTSPFTTLDLDIYCKFSILLTGHKSFKEAEDKNWSMYSESADMLLFNSSTRQYINMSYVLKYMSSSSLAKMTTPIDPYSASIFASNDCDRKITQGNESS